MSNAKAWSNAPFQWKCSFGGALGRKPVGASGSTLLVEGERPNSEEGWVRGGYAMAGFKAGCARKGPICSCVGRTVGDVWATLAPVTIDRRSAIPKQYILAVFSKR